MKRRAVFDDFLELFTFALVACEGDLDAITKTTSKLTWIEEWSMCSEFINNFYLNRWKDFSSKLSVDLQRTYQNA